MHRNDKIESVLVVPYDVRLPKIRIKTRLASQLSHHRLVDKGLKVMEIMSGFCEGLLSVLINGRPIHVILKDTLLGV